jgi:signal transduction histidine kinase
MAHPLPEVLASLGRAAAVLGDALRGADLDHRPAALAAAVLSLWPDAPLAGVLLREATPDFAVVGAGGPLPAREVEVRPLCERAAEVGGLHEEGRLLAAGVPGQAALALALPDSPAPQDGVTVRSLLLLGAAHLATLLEREAAERERRRLEEELAEQTRLADIGVVAGPVAHEINNHLYVLLLQVKVLEMRGGEQFKADLGEIRRQANLLDGLVKQLQRYRDRSRGPQGVTDLNQVAAAAARTVGRAEETAAAPVTLRLAPTPTPVAVAAVDLQRLCSFLLANAARAAGPGGAVILQTEAAEGQALVRIEDSGPALTPEQLARAFEPSASVRSGTNVLELAACRSLARRLSARLECVNRPSGGVAVTVRLPLARA